MTWTATSDAGAFAVASPAPPPGDLRSLIHQELRLLAYYEPVPQRIEEVQQQLELRHAAQLELTAFGNTERPAARAHRAAVVPEPARASRWSAMPWKTASA